MKNVKVLCVVEQFVATCDGDGNLIGDPFGTILNLGKTFNPHPVGETFRVTVERVEVMSEVKVGQIWRQNTDGSSFVVVAVKDGEVGFIKLGGRIPDLAHVKYVDELGCEATLIQDVVEVAK